MNPAFLFTIFLIVIFVLVYVAISVAYIKNKAKPIVNKPHGRMPIIGIYTFVNLGPLELRGTKVEVKITEVTDKYYRITPITVLSGNNPDDFKEHMPKLVEKEEIEILRWSDPTPEPQVDDRRSIKLG